MEGTSRISKKKWELIKLKFGFRASFNTANVAYSVRMYLCVNRQWLNEFQSPYFFAIPSWKQTNRDPGLFTLFK